MPIWSRTIWGYTVRGRAIWGRTVGTRAVCGLAYLIAEAWDLERIEKPEDFMALVEVVVHCVYTLLRRNGTGKNGALTNVH